MNGLLTGAHPDSLLDAQAEMLASLPIAHGQDWESRDLMFYDRVARLGLAGFTFDECNELQSARVREAHLRDFCMLPTTATRHAEMVSLSRLFPIH